jgi:glycosidase
MKLKLLFLILLTSSMWLTAQNAPPPAIENPLPDWAKGAVIYEVNTRQYTPQGTFQAFQSHLPRLQKLGVDILWFMPIHPISKARRKGSLGSYYGVADYKGVNPEFGNLDDFKKIVQEAHARKMKVIMDWVPNHSGWDNAWITEHPEWYTKGPDGAITDPIDPSTGQRWGWDDVADFNYDNTALRAAMVEALLYWIDVADIDGYRFDVSHAVPDDFWYEVSIALKKAKPDIFLLAEGEVPSQRNLGYFHVDYGWNFHNLCKDIATGKQTADAIVKYYQEDQVKFTKGQHMYFTSNHDENSWSGTEFERFGTSGARAFAVLVYVMDGMPLIYSGQEEPLTKRLRFFDKDTIAFKNFSKTNFYQKLNTLKEKNQALWNNNNKPVQFLDSDNPNVIGIYRGDGEDRVVAWINLSNKTQRAKFNSGIAKGMYRSLFQLKKNTYVGDQHTVELVAWGYTLLSTK